MVVDKATSAATTFSKLFKDREAKTRSRARRTTLSEVAMIASIPSREMLGVGTTTVEDVVGVVKVDADGWRCWIRRTSATGWWRRDVWDWIWHGIVKQRRELRSFP